jgi:tetratricopeptide (TPR) repeat protein
MSLLQVALLIAAGVIFYLFFKQLFSGDYPRRGVDFEAEVPDERIGGISRPDKTFKRPAASARPDRIEELLRMADEAIEKGDLLEARKAVQSALILDENNVEALRREGYLLIEDENFEEAEAIYERLLSIDPDDDLAHDSLANVLHKLGKDDAAIAHHEKAIALDPDYAPHYFNYANTLYDLKRYDEALKMYEKAFALDPELKEAERMIEELKEKS